jgi:hypothetical protein
MIPLAIAEEGVTGRRSKPAYAVRAVLQSPWDRGSRLHTADALEGRRLEASEVPARVLGVQHLACPGGGLDLY